MTVSPNPCLSIIRWLQSQCMFIIKWLHSQSISIVTWLQSQSMFISHQMTVVPIHIYLSSDDCNSNPCLSIIEWLILSHVCLSSDDCNPNPCLNGGGCTDMVNGYTCSCVVGYIGQDCQTNEGKFYIIPLSYIYMLMSIAYMWIRVQYQHSSRGTTYFNNLPKCIPINTRLLKILEQH